MRKEFSVKRRRAFTVAVLLFLSSLIALSAWRIVQVNNRWPDPKIRTYSIGEEIMGGDIGITAVDAQILDGQEMLEMVPEFEVVPGGKEPVTIDDFKLLLVDVTVRNASDEDREVPVYHFYAQSYAWSNGIDAEMFHSINEDAELDLSLPANSTMSVQLPYLLFTSQFREWKTAGERPFDLVLSSYPIKCSVRLM